MAYPLQNSNSGGAHVSILETFSRFDAHLGASGVDLGWFLGGAGSCVLGLGCGGSWNNQISSDISQIEQPTVGFQRLDSYSG